MISKKKASLIRALQQKKYRYQHKRFLVEGAKSVQELLQSNLKVELLLYTDEFTFRHNRPETEMIPVSTAELNRLGTFKQNNAALAVVVMPEPGNLSVTAHEFALVLDEVRDPGNLGTIIRIADWYGISKIICAATCADCYNPKVINSSMGSFTRVSIQYTSLSEYLHNTSLPVYGAFMEGEAVHNVNFPKGGLLVMGNESRGVNHELEPFIKHRIAIPSYGNAESLNVAIATAVICDNIRRTNGH